MGNAITINLIYNSLNNKKEKEKKYNISSVEHCYCFYCKMKFKDKTEYNEHLSYCKNGDL